MRLLFWDLQLVFPPFIRAIVRYVTGHTIECDWLQKITFECFVCDEKEFIVCGNFFFYIHFFCRFCQKKKFCVLDLGNRSKLWHTVTLYPWEKVSKLYFVTLFFFFFNINVYVLFFFTLNTQTNNTYTLCVFWMSYHHK